MCLFPGEVILLPTDVELQVESWDLSRSQCNNSRGCVMETEVLVFLEENPFLFTWFSCSWEASLSCSELHLSKGHSCLRWLLSSSHARKKREYILGNTSCLTGSYVSVFGTSVSRLCFLSFFTCCSLPLCPGSSYRGRPQLHHSIRKAKMAGKFPPGVEEVMRRKNTWLPVVLWVSGTVTEVLQHLAMMCHSKNPSRLMQSRCSTTYSHSGLSDYKGEDYCHPNPPSCTFAFSFAQCRIISEACCGFTSPSQSALNPLVATDNVGLETGHLMDL